MLDRACSDSVLVSSCRDGAIRLHDLRTPSLYIPSVCPDAFHKPVLEIHRAHVPTSLPTPAALAATPPSKRRRVMPFSPHQHMSMMQASAASVTAVVTVPHRPFALFSAGAADGAVKLWDLRVGSSSTSATSRRRHKSLADLSRRSPKVESDCVECVTPSDEPRGDCDFAPRRRRHGIASLDVDASGTKLLASSTDSSIYLYDTAQLGLGHSQVLTGHTATSFYVRAAFSPCGRFVASGSADSKGYIWDCHEPRARRSPHKGTRPIVELDGHRGGDVSVVDWCKTDMLKLATCSDDTTVKVWHTNSSLLDRRGGRDASTPSDSREAKDEGYGVSHVLDLDEHDDEHEECVNASNVENECDNVDRSSGAAADVIHGGDRMMGTGGSVGRPGGRRRTRWTTGPGGGSGRWRTGGGAGSSSLGSGEVGQALTVRHQRVVRGTKRLRDADIRSFFNSSNCNNKVNDSSNKFNKKENKLT